MCWLEVGVGLQLLNVVDGTLVYCYNSMLPLNVSCWSRSNHLGFRPSCSQKFHSTGDSALGYLIPSCCDLCCHGIINIYCCCHGCGCLVYICICLFFRILCHLFLLHFRGRHHGFCCNCRRTVGSVFVAGNEAYAAEIYIGWIASGRLIGREVCMMVGILGLLDELVVSISEVGGCCQSCWSWAWRLLMV